MRMRLKKGPKGIGSGREHHRASPPVLPETSEKPGPSRVSGAHAMLRRAKE